MHWDTEKYIYESGVWGSTLRSILHVNYRILNATNIPAVDARTRIKTKLPMTAISLSTLDCKLLSKGHLQFQSVIG